MRLISQDGMIDVPYENTIIDCVNNRTGSYTIYADSYSHCFGLAVYSTELKVKKVMEMLREQYQKLQVTKTLSCGSAECMAEKMSQMEYKMAITEFWKITTFQFPKDEDVEV